MSDNEYFAVKFKIQQDIYFTIWASTEEKDYFLTRNSSLLFFCTEDSLYNFCEVSKINIKAETEFDFSFIVYSNYSDFINKWNIISDLAGTLHLSFLGDSDEMLLLYKKILCGCNLPTLNKSGKVYTPDFSIDEKKQIAALIKNMESILRQSFFL